MKTYVWMIYYGEHTNHCIVQAQSITEAMKVFEDKIGLIANTIQTIQRIGELLK